MPDVTAQRVILALGIAAFLVVLSQVLYRRFIAFPRAQRNNGIKEVPTGEQSTPNTLDELTSSVRSVESAVAALRSAQVASSSLVQRQADAAERLSKAISSFHRDVESSTGQTRATLESQRQLSGN